MVRETELYDIIGVNSNASKEEIKKAYRNKAKILHPDKGGDPDKFKKLSYAYEILGNEEKKKLYDKFGKNGLKNNPDISEDIFSNLFNMGGNSFNMFNMFTRGFNKPKTRPILHNYNVTLEQLCTNKIVTLRYVRDRLCGCNKGYNKCKECNGNGVNIQHIQLGPGLIQQIQKECKECKGSGSVNKGCEKCKNGILEEKNEVNLYLKPTMVNGYKYIFKDEGDENSEGVKGDFIVILKYKKHKEFYTKDDNNLYVYKNISLKESLTGYVIHLEHPNGEKISVNTSGQIIQPSTTITYKEKGMSKDFNMIISFTIDFPKMLSNEQIEKIKQIL